jgi:hypothetical protein
MNRILLRKPTRSFTKGKFWTKTMAMLLFFFFFSLASVRAQVAVTVTSGATNVTPNLAATYSSFANLTAALNTITAMTGAVNIQLSGGTEVAPPKGFTIGSTTLNAALTASAGNGGNGGINITGIFVGYNNPSNTNLVGGVGTATGASASPDGILKLVGADYIGLTYISFIDPTTNTTPTTSMEFGVALFKASPTDGCQHNYIDTNFFTMQRLNTTVGSGPMIGEAAIIIVNSIPSAAVTSITPTSNSGASTDNEIRNNDINGGANGISLYGYPAPAPYNFVDTRNSITGNNVRNFGGGIPATSSNGIITRAQWETDIEYNNVNNNDGFGVNQNSNLYGINVFNATNSNSITSNNVIKLQSDTTTGGQVYGIYNSINAGGNVPGFSTTINNNTIDMAQPLLTTVGNMRGIYCISSSQILTISNNVISGLSPFAFTGNAYGIYTQGTATTTTITNNSIKNFNRTGTTGITYGILCQGTAATTTATTGPTNVVADGNTIDNLTFTATDNTGFLYGINAGVNTITNTINNNVVKNLAVGTSGSIYGIYDNGIAGTKVCQNNQVFNFSTPAGVGTSTYNSYYGIYYTNNAIAALNLDITGNSIYSLNNLGTGTNGDVYGIYCTALQPSSIYKNKIYDLSYNGTNTTVNGWVSGIFALNNVSTIYNNTIADLRMPNYAQPAQKLFGIRVSNANLYYNTVFLSGTNASSAAVFSYTAGSLKLNNNIFINTVTPNSGGIATAYSRADTTINTYTASSNYNLFAGTNIYYDGTSTDATLAAYKTRMATRDQNSVTETTTPFISTVGSNVDFLRLPLNAISVANNNALPITSPAITTDYWGITRSSTTPDIGASEFIGLVCTIPTVYTVTGGGNGCGSTGVPVGLSNSQTGVNYQLKLNGVATGGLVAGTGAALSFGNQTVAGTYTVDATSNVVGCTTPIAMSGNAIVTTSPAVNATSSQTNVSCNGGSNGTATVVASGGTAPFTYLWSPTGGTSATTTGRPVGAYTCTITDAVGCSTSKNFTITQPPAISTASWSQTNIACNGGSTGAASVSPSGGTAPYTYSWSNGPTTQSITGLAAGIYTVTVTDNNSCTATRNYTITQPTAVSASAVQTNVACNGGTNGAINLTPFGGTSGYTFNWGSGITTEDRTGLAAGTYSVTITDANGCTGISSYTITQPTAISGSAVVTNVACNGGANGAINLTPSGGTPGYTYNWGGGITTEDRTGLAAGAYSVTITDANGCSAIRGFTVTQPTSALTSTEVSKTNILCFGGNNGSATISVSGGTAGYSYNWTPGNPPGDGTATITGITAATWTCTITDANGCTTSRNVTITQPWALDAIASTHTNVVCNGNSTGSATVLAANGTAPYTYDWTPGNPTGDGTNIISNVVAGTYNCLVTDANGCNRNVGFTITQSAAIDNSISQALGVVSANQSGATYQWYECPSTLISGETNQNYTPTVAGDYKVNVTLAGCTVNSSCITVSTLGTESFAFNSKLSVYPNPSSDVFSINSDTRGTIVVYDLIGKIIKSENIDLGITKLDLSKYPSGLYFMKVTNDSNQTKTMKLIKQ